MNAGPFDIELRLAKATLREGKVDEAELMYRGILDEQPDCAEALHFLGVAALEKGRLDEALRLMKQSLKLEPHRREFHNNLSTVLGQMNRTAEALESAEQAIRIKGESAEAWNNKGFALGRLGRMDEAIEAYRRSIELRPKYLPAITNLGAAFSRVGRHDQAVDLLSHVVRRMPRNAQAHTKLATAFRLAGSMYEAVDAYRAATELTPRDPNLLNDLGGALQETGNPAGAEAALRRCLSIKPDHPDGHWNLGLALLTQGRWREGWPQYEWRRKLRFDQGEQGRFTQPTWDGTPVNGKTILVTSEQGLGDTIQFIRYAPLLKQRGAKVVMECQAQLRPLLQSVQDVDGYVARGETLPKFDLHVRLMTLPYLLGSTPANIPCSVPYLRVDERLTARFAKLLQKVKGFRVGIVWQGNRAHHADRFRSMPLPLLAPLSRIEGVRLISLQKGPGIDQIPGNRAALKLIEWANPQDISPRAWIDTAAMLRALDLVIGVDTAVCHVAGALAVPVWTMLSVGSDWRWMLDRQDTPWYPTMRLFRQKKLGRWEDVVETVTTALRELAASRTPFSPIALPKKPVQMIGLAPRSQSRL